MKLLRVRVLACLVLAACQPNAGDVDNDSLSSHDASECAPPKVAVCHIPPGNPENAHTLCVGASAEAAHLAHGDTPGDCAPSCVPDIEICDGIDNDCNGLIDDDVIEDGSLCGSDVGECSFGSQVCINGALECQGGQGPTPEFSPDLSIEEILVLFCDRRDNDCDGLVDENFDLDGDGLTVCDGDCDDAIFDLPQCPPR